MKNKNNFKYIFNHITNRRKNQIYEKIIERKKGKKTLIFLS